MVIKSIIFSTPNISYECWKTQASSHQTPQNRLPLSLLIWWMNATFFQWHQNVFLILVTFLQWCLIRFRCLHFFEGPAWLAFETHRNKTDAGFLLLIVVGVFYEYYSLIDHNRYLLVLSVPHAGVPSPAHTIRADKLLRCIGIRLFGIVCLSFSSGPGKVGGKK